MSHSDELPRLTEAQVRELATPQSFERGQSYYRNGNLFNLMRQGQTLRAECQGTEVYRSKVMFDRQGITKSSCTCPYDWGGLCKHLIALLLTYVHKPQAFFQVPSLTNQLASRSPDELIALIEQMVQRYPDLMSLIELSVAKSQGKTINVSTYRRQVQRALKRDEVREIVDDLEMVTDIAGDLLQSGDVHNAGRLYQMLLEEMNASYDHNTFAMDYKGDMAGLAQDFAEGLGQCLKQLEDSQIRHDGLTTLLDAVFKELELGGIDYAYPAPDLLLDSATDDDWHWIESLIRDRIAESDRWEREMLVQLLAKRRTQQGQSEAVSSVIHELGSPEQRAFLLLKEGKLDEAIAIAHDHFSELAGLVIRFANELVEVGAPDRALQYITSQPSTSYRGYKDWLADFHRDHGNLEIALTVQQDVFELSPSLDSYKQLKDLAQQVGTWEQLHPQLLARLENTKNWAVLIDLAIEDADLDRAIALLSRLQGWGQWSYILKVAEAAEQPQPQTAIDLYRQLVDHQIAQRGRSSYSTAAQYLILIRTLYERLGEQEGWRSYIQQLRKHYKRLSALQDELDQAGV